MSTKTAEDWINEGDAFDDQGKQDEAIACFDKAIDINPHIARAHFLKGYVLSNKGLKSQAIFCLDRAIELNPEYDTALNTKADILSSQGEHEEAIKVWERAIEVNPQYAIAIHNMANSQRALGKNDEALASYDKALEIDANYSNCYYSKAYTLDNLSRYSDAVECLKKLLPLTPDDARALNMMANCLVKLEKIQESIEYYTKAIDVLPETPLYLCNRGVAHVKLGHKKEALDDFMQTKKFLDKVIYGDNTGADNVSFMKETIGPVSEYGKISELNEAVKKLDQSKPEVQSLVSQLKKLQDEMNKHVDVVFQDFDNKPTSDTDFKAELAKLKEEFQEQFKLMQPEKEANAKAAEELVAKGDAFDDQGKPDEAIKCFDEAIALDPDNVRAHFLKGYVLSNKELRDLAIFSLDRAIELNPEHDMALNTKADILSTQGEHEEAIKVWERAIEVNPQYSNAIHNMANSQRALGKNEEALASYDKALEIDPKYANCYYSKAYTLDNMSKYSEAVECLKKLFELDPEDARALNMMANCLVKLDRVQESIEYYTKAIKVKSDNPLYFCNRGVAYNKLDQKKEALQDFLKAKDLLDRGIMGDNVNADNVSFMKETLGAIADLQKIADENEAALKKLDQSNPIVKKFAANLKKLQDQKNKVTEEVFQDFGNTGSADTPDFRVELDRLKQEYQKQFQMMQAELNNVKSNVTILQKDVKQLKDEVGEIKEDLNNKLDDFNKKLDSELTKSDLAPENIAKVKEYFKAFLETFSSTHVTAQVVDSGQVSLDVGSTKVTILSTLASFAPFIGSGLSEGVKSLGEFLESRELKKNARKMKSLAADATALSQIIGKVALEISLNKAKQQEVTKATEDDLRKLSGSMFLKIQKFCDNLSDDIDAFLYTRLYSTPAAMLGHQDANKIIQKWVEGHIVPFSIHAQFVETVIGGETTSKPKEEEKTTPVEVDRGRSACCNMF